MECKVSISIDLALPIIPPLMSPHDYAPMGTTPPLPPPSSVGLAVEPNVNMYWPFGVLMGKCKLTEDKVKHGGFDIVLDSHDCGPMIPHLQILPPPPGTNVLTILHILKSKRKAKFSAGEIKAKGKPIAHCIFTNLPPTPMTSCGKPLSLPYTGAPTSHGNTLILGVHWIDLVVGWVTIGIEAIFELISSKTPSTSATSFGEAVQGEFTSWGSDLLSGGGGTEDKQSALGNDDVGGIVSGMVRFTIQLAGQQLFDYHGDARLSLSSRAGPYSTGVSYTRDGATHDHTFEANQGIAGPLGLGGASLSEQVTADSDGGNVEGRIRGSGNVGGAGGHVQHESTDGWDASGHWPDI